jgi:predicted MFS family arabinose efflux permease
MLETAPVELPRSAAVVTGQPGRRLRTGYFTLEAMSALAAASYFNYLFFYLREHFGFDNQNNLLLTAMHGFLYIFCAWSAGHLAQKRGYFFLLRLGFSGKALALIVGGLAPRFFGYSHTTLVVELGAFVMWTASVCLVWPSFQGLLARNQPPEALSRTAGAYNIVWATGSAVANLIGGVVLDKLGGEALFWLPAGVQLAQLALLARLEKMSAAEVAPQVKDFGSGAAPPLNPRPIAKARLFLRMAWLANPFAYIAIYGFLPVVPKLSERFGLTPTYAGLVFSAWYWARLGAFVWFWRWPGWHYRFGWLLAAFLALIASFGVVLMSPQIWMSVAAQVVFGLAVGLIYYSSLFYSMDTGESKTKRGGVHEAVIGLGIFTGPAVGVTALHFSSGQAGAGAWAISGILLVGLAGLLRLRYRKA